MLPHLVSDCPLTTLNFEHCISQDSLETRAEGMDLYYKEDFRRDHTMSVVQFNNSSLSSVCIGKPEKLVTAEEAAAGQMSWPVWNKWKWAHRGSPGFLPALCFWAAWQVSQLWGRSSSLC